LVSVRHVIGIGSHELRPPRPGGIGVLALNLIEAGGGEAILAVIEVIARKVVDRPDVALDIFFFLVAAAGGQESCRESYARPGREKTPKTLDPILAKANKLH